MKILLCCMLHSYGDVNREYSYEYFSLYLSLKSMGYEVELFDFMSEERALGKEDMNKKLKMRVEDWQPDLTMFALYTDQFDPQVVRSLQDFTITFCFFCDDTWRKEFSQFWARQFNYFSSPDIHAVVKYRELGLSNCYYFPFGCNYQVFKKTPSDMKYDVSFVGGRQAYREWIIRKIRRAGIKVKVAGYGWPEGEASQDEMIDIFNSSRINLNLSNSSSWDIRYLLSSPKAFLHMLRSKKQIEQMKARFFEVNGCGGFQLTYYVEGLANCYEIDKEIAVYADPNDLIEKIVFYLKHEVLRNSIASAGYDRTLKHHTYQKRFQEFFDSIGLDHG